MAVQEVERELRAHEKQWEVLREASERDSEVIGQLTASKEQLERELQERVDNVRHLEGLLEEVCVHACVCVCVCVELVVHMSPCHPTHPGW